MRLKTFENANLQSAVKAVIGIAVIVLIFKVIDDIANAKPQPQLVLVKEQPKRKEFTKNTKEEVLERQGYRCNSCGQYSSLFDFHHKNGDRSNNCSSNCEALCPNCHAKKTRK